MTKKQRGGTRLNSGAKPKYNESTTAIAFRVPISHKERITKIVKEYLNKLKK